MNTTFNDTFGETPVADTWHVLDGWGKTSGTHVASYGWLEKHQWQTLGMLWMVGETPVAHTWNVIDGWRNTSGRHIT